MPDKTDYCEKKKLIHQRLFESPAHHEFNLITYNANSQFLKDFEKRLRSSITYLKCEKRASRVKIP